MALGIVRSRMLTRARNKKLTIFKIADTDSGSSDARAVLVSVIRLVSNLASAQVMSLDCRSLF